MSKHNKNAKRVPNGALHGLAITQKGQKNPSIASSPPRPTRKPYVAPRDAEHSSHRVVWKVEIIDTEGPFGWHRLPPEQIIYMLQRLKEMESRSWVEIDRNSKRDHYISPAKLSSEAKNRLAALELDDAAESLFSLRLEAKLRIYGLRINNVFCLLWYDPEHEVCPSKGPDN